MQQTFLQMLNAELKKEGYVLKIFKIPNDQPKKAGMKKVNGVNDNGQSDYK